MAGIGAQNKKAVVVFFHDSFHTLACEHHMTMAQVRTQWQDASGLPISVAFFCGERLLPDHLTIGEALPNAAARSLELTAIPRRKLWLQVIGFEETNALFEVAPSLSPAAVRRDIEAAVGIHTDDFRLTRDGAELDPELSFEELGLTEGAQILVDLRAIINVHFNENNETKKVECFASDSIGDLRKKLNCGDDTALVSTSPFRRVLEDPLRVCHIVTDLLELEMPIALDAEKKVMLAFEPITLEHLRQKIPVAISWTPLDVYDTVKELFQLKTEHRLAVNGQPLDNCEPLLNQLLDTNDVIQVDILRPFLVSDLWEDPLDVDSLQEVYLYSTENCHTLYLRDELSDQRLFYDDINLTVFGSVVDVLGPISGQEKAVLVVDRDVERSCPTLTFDRIVRKLVWARDMLLDVVPSTGGHLPKEITRSGHVLPARRTLGELRMTEDTLTIIDPEKVFVSFEKKLHMCRFAHSATYGDIRTRMQQLKGSLDIGLKTREWHIPDNAMTRKFDRELLFLTNEARFQTKVTVTMGNQWYGCWFEPQQVSFTDIMVNVGKQAKVMPRLLFCKKLYCCGCGRQLSQKEEPHQTIPATCCGVRSLQLTDRRTKDVGIQAAGSRRRDVQTFTLDPESRGSATDLRPSSSLHIVVQSPDGEKEKKMVAVEGGNGRALLTAVDRRFSDEIPLGDSPVIVSTEFVYDREGEERRATICIEQEQEKVSYINLQDGAVVDESSLLRASFRLFRPSSPLPSAPGHLPAISIQTEVEFVTFDPQGHLQAAPASASTDPSFVASLWGVRSGTQMFWELLRGVRYFNAGSGQVFKLKEIPGGPKRFIFALLRDGDPVPRVRVPPDEELLVLKRAGLEFRAEEGRVRCVEPPQPTDMDLWDIGTDETFFKDFAAAASCAE